MSVKFKFNRTAFLKRISAAAKEGNATGAAILQREIVANLNRGNSNPLTGGSPSPAGQPPYKMWGALGRSIQWQDKNISATHLKRIVGTKLKYAHIQEFGGRIVPVKARYLTIPLNADAVRMLRNTGGNLRSETLRVVKTSKGLFLVKDVAKGAKVTKGAKTSKAGGVVFLFILKKQVILPARPFMRPALAKRRADIRKAQLAPIKAVLAKYSRRAA